MATVQINRHQLKPVTRISVVPVGQYCCAERQLQSAKNWKNSVLLARQGSAALLRVIMYCMYVVQCIYLS